MSGANLDGNNRIPYVWYGKEQEFMAQPSEATHHDVARQVHDVISKWTRRGYIIAEVATKIEADLQAVFRGEA